MVCNRGRRNENGWKHILFVHSIIRIAALNYFFYYYYYRRRHRTRYNICTSNIIVVPTFSSTSDAYEAFAVAVSRKLDRKRV